MKTRVISGIVAAMLLISLLVLNSYFSIVVVVAVAILSAIAVFEIIYNTGCIKSTAVVVAAMLYAFAVQFAYKGLLCSAVTLTIIYTLVVVFFAVFEHTNFGERQITMALSMPIIISFAFSSLERLINVTDGTGLLYFILIFNFACISDIAAYFVGSALGKHKLAPVISPKKTVEGAIGGLIGAMIGTVIVCLVFEAILTIDIKVWVLVLITPVMSIVGILGDLFASAVKRNYGIKDYGNIMPGHGGILDRTDSVLLVSVVFSLFLNYVSVIK